MGVRLISWRQISAKINRGRSWIFAKAKSQEGGFPRPLALPALPGKSLWDEAEIDRWIEAEVTKAKARAGARCDG